jgi:hypothetical protein
LYRGNFSHPHPQDSSQTDKISWTSEMITDIPFSDSIICFLFLFKILV